MPVGGCRADRARPVTASWLAWAASAAAATVVWWAGGSLVDRPAWRRRNYRGHELAGVGGVVSAFVTLATLTVVLAIDVDGTSGAHGGAALLLGVGFAGLGLFDDLGADRSGGGFGGHLSALVRERRVTTGLVKLMGGAAIALVGVTVAATAGPATVSDALGGSGWIDVLRGGALVALSANLVNLFDRAPGRATKVAGLWWIVLLLIAGADDSATLVWAGAAVGALVGLLWFDLREELMLGDTGVNPAGALLGLSVVLVAGTTAEWVALAVVVALNLLSERVSFTAIIDRTAALRWFDRLGSPHR